MLWENGKVSNLFKHIRKTTIGLQFFFKSTKNLQITNSLLSGVTKTNMKSSCEFLAGENDVF